jgi:RND family efflux transporter MFP subunit
VELRQIPGRLVAGVGTALVAVLIIGALIGASWAGSGPGGSPLTPSPWPSSSAAPTPPDTSVHAQAIVVPARSAELSAGTAGRVEKIFVEQNSQVSAGALLLRFDQSAYKAALDVATANVRRAQAAVDQKVAELELLPADAPQAQRDAAQAGLDLAHAELQVAVSNQAQAQVELTQTELRAPFDGTVADISVEVGEQAAPGEILLTIADFSSWLIETTDLSELDVVRVGVGDTATITFPALPGIVLGAVVDRVQLRGTSESGAALFTVVIKPDQTDAPLHWNMSAAVVIDPRQ